MQDNCKPIDFWFVGKRRKMSSVLHVEVLMFDDAEVPEAQIKSSLKKLDLIPGCEIREFSDPFLRKHVEVVAVCDMIEELREPYDVDYKFYFYTLDRQTKNEVIVDGDEKLVAAQHWAVPSVEFHGKWESLIYDHNIKENLLNFAETAMLFSDRGVDPNLITWNRLVLLHGPPGTGKTTLCKALAQKLAIRMSSRYPNCEFIEINSHSLFSKWFSESGKLVMKMFAKIHEIREDPKTMVFILIDEVESLAHARKSSAAGTEPSDSIRVVNALLTQIDQIKNYSNVMILTTSNITASIDLAFVDRADIKQYIGNPSSKAIYNILLSCIKELQRSGIISAEENIMTLKLLELASFKHSDTTDISLKLLKIAEQCEGLSGRSIRKLPFLAHAYCIHNIPVSLEAFLGALARTVQKQKTDTLEF